MKIYFDIGNTNIKLNYKIGGEDRYISFSTKDKYTVDSFYNMLPPELKDVKTIWICSVVPTIKSIIIGMAKKYWKSGIRILEAPIKTGIKFKVDNPKSLGADIVALSLFVSSKTNNGLIINMGTATTITHVKNKELIGVVIIPGFQTSLNALLRDAAKLSQLELKISQNKIGKNTEEAISIGMLNGTKYMLEGIVNSIDPEADVFLSGGNARPIKKMLNNFNFVKEATIEGLKIIGDLNEK